MFGNLCRHLVNEQRPDFVAEITLKHTGWKKVKNRLYFRLLSSNLHILLRIKSEFGFVKTEVKLPLFRAGINL